MYFLFFTAALSAMALLPAPSLADAYKCRTSTGSIVVSSSPCGEAEKAVQVQRSDNIPAYQQQNALNDLERQKQFLRMREREQQSTSGYVSNTNSHQGTGNAYDADTRDRIHSCLMKITATSGISSGETARRRLTATQGRAAWRMSVRGGSLRLAASPPSKIANFERNAARSAARLSFRKQY